MPPTSFMSPPALKKRSPWPVRTMPGGDASRDNARKRVQQLANKGVIQCVCRRPVQGHGDHIAVAFDQKGVIGFHKNSLSEALWN
ncbi:CMP-2-keto-3-deoxyoctulosonic acid synthetase [Bradyrhizobium elkanii]|uniref:hypothetical protein n=1 Tax=Bradyrhizobium elkanii TaxID=29448 RepID=UPI003513E8FE